MGESEQGDGLKAIATEALEIDQVRTFLDARYEGHAEGVVHAGRGEWPIAYSFRVGGADSVIRFGKLDQKNEEMIQMLLHRIDVEHLRPMSDRIDGISEGTARIEALLGGGAASSS